MRVLAKNKKVAPEAKRAIQRLKIETAEEIGVNLSNKRDMGDFTSNQIGQMAKTGRLGGHMTKKMVESAKNGLVNKNKPKLK